MDSPIIATLLTISVRCGEQEGPIKNGIRKVNDETAREEIPHYDELLLWYSQVLKHEEITSGQDNKSESKKDVEQPT
jgi:hypothetical protein